MPIQQEELTQCLQASSSHTVTLPSGQQGRRSHRRESHFTSELPGSHTPAHFLSCSVKQGNKSFLLGVTARSSYGARSVRIQGCEQPGLLLSPEPMPSCTLEPAHSIQPCARLGFLFTLGKLSVFNQPPLPTPGTPAKGATAGDRLTPRLCSCGLMAQATPRHMPFLPAR